MGSLGTGLGQGITTPDQFNEIAAKPGDTLPLASELARVPFLTNATVPAELRYQTGRVFSEDAPGSARTVEGKYIIFTMPSQFYHRPMNTILTFDQQASALKVYSLYGDTHGGDMVIEATVVYDYARKIYATSSSYGGFKEVTVGSYADSGSSDHTLVFKDGVLFLTREVHSMPANRN